MIDKDSIPDTGLSGLYEVFLATGDLSYTIRYFEQFGFQEVGRGVLSAAEANRLYGYHSPLESIRMQNGSIDTHGLLRILVWDQIHNSGVGFGPPRTLGQRMTVMRTDDIYRIKDVYDNDINSHYRWLTTHPVADDLFGLNNKNKDFFNRPIIVRENAVYGTFFNHIFFQRYGYHIEGYGTIDKKTPLKTSEFTHHDFFIRAHEMSEIHYLSTVLGLWPEDEPKIDSSTQKGPREVFMLQDGESHWYQGFVSPNNICGKLKFFIPRDDVEDRSDGQVMGSLGVTMHSFYSDKLSFIHELASEEDLDFTDIYKNEFGERCFCIFGTEGCRWQIIEKSEFQHQSTKELEFTLTNN